MIPKNKAGAMNIKIVRIMFFCQFLSRGCVELGDVFSPRFPGFSDFFPNVFESLSFV